MSNNEKKEFRVGCGCFSVLLEFLALVALCYIIGCDWAVNLTKNTINRFRSDVSGGNHSEESPCEKIN